MLECLPDMWSSQDQYPSVSQCFFSNINVSETNKSVNINVLSVSFNFIFFN